MKKAWNVVFIAALAALLLGGVSFGLSLLLGADLVRIADVVFSRYDLTQTYLNFENLLAQVTGFVTSLF